MSDGAAGSATGIATTLQKLPQLDTEHLRAITASFPGRLLGRTAALLSLAALLLGWFKLVDWALPQELLSFRTAHPHLFNASYYGIPILIVLGQLVREALEARRKKRMAARVIEGVVANPMYFRLRPTLSARTTGNAIDGPTRQTKELLSGSRRRRHPSCFSPATRASARARFWRPTTGASDGKLAIRIPQFLGILSNGYGSGLIHRLSRNRLYNRSIGGE